MKFKKTASLLISIISFFGMAIANPISNDDVIKMVESNLDASIIITMIETADVAFDTSPQGLVGLSGASVPAEIIRAMITRVNAPAASAAVAAKPKTDANMLKPSDVLLLDDGKESMMKYLTPQVRTAARGMGFGGVASYSVLRGSNAALRISNPQPVFLVSVPKQAQIESYLTLASFAVRRNNSREVLIGGGYMSYSSGIHPDRVIDVTATPAADQSRAADGFTLFEVRPSAPLPQGEYALILYTSEMGGLVGSWFAGSGNAYFDFGKD